DQSSTRGSWLGRSAVYSGSTIEWQRPRMLKVGATVLSLELPEEMRHTAPPAVPSAGMTPPPRAAKRSTQGSIDPAAAHDGEVAPGPLTPSPPQASAPLAAGNRSQRKAWKRSGLVLGKVTGIALL